MNIALGLSVLSWAVLGFLRADPSARFTLVRLSMTALNTGVGVLFLGRDRARATASVRGFLWCLPSLFASGAALKLAPSPELWPFAPSLLFCAGALFALFALVSLGRCFGLLPAARGLVLRGLFRWIRHPAYAGEIAMLIACAWAGAARAWGALIAVAALGFLRVRIQLEEELLEKTFPEYGDYRRRVKYRLIPGVW